MMKVKKTKKKHLNSFDINSTLWIKILDQIFSLACLFNLGERNTAENLYSDGIKKKKKKDEISRGDNDDS